jgi:hypothetical protein
MLYPFFFLGMSNYSAAIYAIPLIVTQFFLLYIGVHYNRAADSGFNLICQPPLTRDGTSLVPIVLDQHQADLSSKMQMWDVGHGS